MHISSTRISVEIIRKQYRGGDLEVFTQKKERNFNLRLRAPEITSSRNRNFNKARFSSREL